VTLNDSSSVSVNTANRDGGGVYNHNSGVPITLNGTSTITNNSAGTGYHGGGVYGTTNGIAGVNIYDNTPDDVYP
jgi:hypothetical protein